MLFSDRIFILLPSPLCMYLYIWVRCTIIWFDVYINNNAL